MQPVRNCLIEAVESATCPQFAAKRPWRASDAGLLLSNQRRHHAQAWLNIGRIAVVFELRQTQDAIVASTYQARAVDAIAGSRHVADSQYIAALLAEVDFDTDAIASLTNEELLRLRAFYVGQMIDFDNEFYQYQKGFLDDEYYEYWFKRRLPLVARQWRALGIVENRPSFREFVDEQLSTE